MSAGWCVSGPRFAVGVCLAVCCFSVCFAVLGFFLCVKKVRSTTGLSDRGQLPEDISRSTCITARYVDDRTKLSTSHSLQWAGVD